MKAALLLVLAGLATAPAPPSTETPVESPAETRVSTPAAAAPAACAPVLPVLPPYERLAFDVYYQWGLLWVNAGDLNLTLQQSPLPGDPNGPHYPHAVARAVTAGRVHRLFPVNDRYETWFEPGSVLPRHFIRDICEGKARFYWEYKFQQPNGSVWYKHWSKTRNQEGYIDGVNGCSLDLFSTLYHLRSIDWSQYRPGQRVPLDLIVDGKPLRISVEFLRRERIKTKLGYTDCLVLSPQLVTGEYFKTSDGLTLWLSDDQRRLPVRCEAKILVGALKADLLPG